MSLRHLWGVALAASLLMALPLRAEWPVISPDLKMGRVTLRKVLILPAQIDYKVIGFKGVKERTEEEGERVAGKLYEAVSAELSARGVVILPNLREGAKTDSERYAIADLQARYDAFGYQLRKKPGMIQRGKLTLDDRVAGFEPGQDSDALVFLRGYGHVGEPMGSGIVSAVGLHITVAFVGSKTGEVLGLVRFSPGFAHPDSKARLAGDFREALHDLPLPLRPARH
jgi:hypothetical protein